MRGCTALLSAPLSRCAPIPARCLILTPRYSEPVPANGSGHFNSARTGRARAGIPLRLRPHATSAQAIWQRRERVASLAEEGPAGTLSGAPATPPNAKKLRRVRQALVRESESTPKCGVKAGNNLGRLRSRAASIGKQDGIRKGRNRVTDTNCSGCCRHPHESVVSVKW